MTTLTPRNVAAAGAAAAAVATQSRSICDVVEPAADALATTLSPLGTVAVVPQFVAGLCSVTRDPGVANQLRQMATLAASVVPMGGAAARTAFGAERAVAGTVARGLASEAPAVEKAVAAATDGGTTLAGIVASKANFQAVFDAARQKMTDPKWVEAFEQASAGKLPFDTWAQNELARLKSIVSPTLEERVQKDLLVGARNDAKATSAAADTAQTAAKVPPAATPAPVVPRAAQSPSAAPARPAPAPAPTKAAAPVAKSTTASAQELFSAARNKEIRFPNPTASGPGYARVLKDSGKTTSASIEGVLADSSALAVTLKTMFTDKIANKVRTLPASSGGDLEGDASRALEALKDLKGPKGEMTLASVQQAEKRVEKAIAEIERHGLAMGPVENQMLQGLRDLGDGLRNLAANWKPGTNTAAPSTRNMPRFDWLGG